MRFVFSFLLFASVLAAAPRIVYSKYFKGSSPELSIIVIGRDGASTYQEAKEDDNPIRFQLSRSDTAALFDVASKLGYFDHPLESSARVAHTGIKTFRYEDGPQSHEVKFNYSDDPDARQMVDWFDHIIETEQDFIELERTMHFEKLGVDRALAHITMTQDRKRLVAPEQFLPMLDKVSKDESFLHIARMHAAALAENIRAASASSSASAQP